MSIEIMASGNLVMEPIERQNQQTSYIAFTVVVDVNTETGREPMWIDAAVSGQLMLRAAKLKRGDGVWLRGHVTLRRYKHRNEKRVAYQMAVNELITHRETYEA